MNAVLLLCGGSPGWMQRGQRATELRSTFSTLSGFSQVASPQNCWSVRSWNCPSGM
jgi:hypothetical protein